MIKSITNIFVLMLMTLCTLILYVNFFDNSITYANILGVMNLNYIIIIYILSISFVSDYLYNKSNNNNNSKKLDESISSFKYISLFIRTFTVIIAICSILIDNFFGYEFHDNQILIYSGISMSAIAISLFISAKISLGGNYSDCYEQRKPSKIVKTGLYASVRHPIYTSNIILVLSVLIISGSYLIFVSLLLITLFYTISAFREERYLVNRFPSYERYSKRTGMFVPKYWK